MSARQLLRRRRQISVLHPPQFPAADPKQNRLVRQCLRLRRKVEFIQKIRQAKIERLPGRSQARHFSQASRSHIFPSTL